MRLSCDRLLNVEPERDLVVPDLRPQRFGVAAARWNPGPLCRPAFFPFVSREDSGIVFVRDRKPAWQKEMAAFLIVVIDRNYFRTQRWVVYEDNEARMLHGEFTLTHSYQ